MLNVTPMVVTPKKKAIKYKQKEMRKKFKLFTIKKQQNKIR